MKLTREQRQSRAKYQAEYRRTHPEYVKRCRELEKPKLDRYRKNTLKRFKEKVINEWLKEGMLFGDGWRIEITHLKGKHIQTNRKMIKEWIVEESNMEVLKLEFARMLYEMSPHPKKEEVGEE